MHARAQNHILSFSKIGPRFQASVAALALPLQVANTSLPATTAVWAPLTAAAGVVFLPSSKASADTYNIIYMTEDQALGLPEMNNVDELASFLENSKGQGKAVRFSQDMLNKCTNNPRCLNAMGETWKVSTAVDMKLQAYVMIFAEGDVDTVNKPPPGSSYWTGPNDSEFGPRFGFESVSGQALNDPEESKDQAKDFKGFRLCSEESAAHLEARRQLQELEERLQEKRLVLKPMVDELGKLTGKPHENLIKALSSHLITIPVPEATLLIEGAQRVISYSINKHFTNKADASQERINELKQKIAYHFDQYKILVLQRVPADKQIEMTGNTLNECRYEKPTIAR